MRILLPTLVLFVAQGAWAASPTLDCARNRGHFVAKGLEDQTLTCFDYEPETGGVDVYVSVQRGVSDRPAQNPKYFDLQRRREIGDCKLSAVPKVAPGPTYYRYSCSRSKELTVQEVDQMLAADSKAKPKITHEYPRFDRASLRAKIVPVPVRGRVENRVGDDAPVAADAE